MLSFGPLKAGREEGREAAACLADSSRSEPCLAPRSAGKENCWGSTRPPRVVYLATHGFYNAPLKLPPDDPFLPCGIAFAGLHYLPADPGQESAACPA